MRSSRTQDQQGHNPQSISSPRQPRRWGHSIGTLFRTLSLMTTGGTVAIALILFIGVWKTGNDFFGKVAELWTAPQPEPQVDLRSMVVQQVRNASELTTAVYSMETVVPASRDRTVGGYVIGKTTLLYIAYGEIRAGVDLAELTPANVQTNGNTLTLRLPPAKILDSKIDVNRSQVYDYDRGFLGLGPDAAPELQELAQRQTLEKMVASACANGVLQSANDRAKLTVSQLLNVAGYTQVFVETHPPNASDCSLTPPTPAPIPSVIPLPPPPLVQP